MYVCMYMLEDDIVKPSIMVPLGSSGANLWGKILHEC
jgi:hypothetical protein